MNCASSGRRSAGVQERVTTVVSCLVLGRCGILVNADSLEVQADYSRYAGTHIKASMSVPLADRPGRGGRPACRCDSGDGVAASSRCSVNLSRRGRLASSSMQLGQSVASYRHCVQSSAWSISSKSHYCRPSQGLVQVSWTMTYAHVPHLHVCHSAVCTSNRIYATCSSHPRHLARLRVLPNAGRQLMYKLAQYTRPKMHALLLDTSLNSSSTVRLNIFQVSRACPQSKCTSVCLAMSVLQAGSA